MGSNTKNYRQTKSSMSGGRGAQAYARISRAGSWLNNKARNFVSTRGKARPEV